MAYTPPGETRRKIYRFLCERLASGAPPTLREVQRTFGFRSVESARAQLEALVEEGRLTKLEGQSRGYRLKGQSQSLAAMRLIPLLGSVQAGNLTAAIEENEGYLPVESHREAEDLFALRVSGESMIGVGIFPGDVVLVRKQAAASSGDIVVALVSGLEDEATVKTLKRQGNRWILQPENPRFSPIVPKPGTLRILGKVIEVRRYFEPLPLVTEAS
jgi:repressor LexA